MMEAAKQNQWNQVLTCVQNGGKKERERNSKLGKRRSEVLKKHSGSDY